MCIIHNTYLKLLDRAKILVIGAKSNYLASIVYSEFCTCFTLSYYMNIVSKKFYLRNSLLPLVIT